MNASVTSLLEKITSLEQLVEKQSILIEQLQARIIELEKQTKKIVIGKANKSSLAESLLTF